MTFLGRWQGDPGGDCRPPMSGQGVDSRSPTGDQIKALLRTLFGIGTDSAETIGAVSGRTIESHTTPRNTTGAGQTVGRDFRVCP